MVKLGKNEIRGTKIDKFGFRQIPFLPSLANNYSGKGKTSGPGFHF